MSSEPQLADYHVVKRKSNPPSKWGIKAISIGHDVYYRFFANEEKPTVWHWCTHMNRWAGNTVNLHALVSKEPLQLDPSLLCPLCGWHGFIRQGRWEPV